LIWEPEMPRPKRDSQQRATRNTFIQKGAEVQKIDQGGIWAQIVDSYPNPDFESVCFSQEVGSGSGNDDEFVSIAKWVYKCRRLIRKSGHIVASIRNGEISIHATLLNLLQKRGLKQGQ